MKVFCATYGGGHVNLIASIYKEMLANSIEVKILALTIAGQQLKKNNIPYKTISQYINLFEDREFIELGKKVVDNVHNENSNINYNDTLVYYGLGLSELLNEKGGIDWCKYESEGRKAFCPVNKMKVILNNEKPDVVLLTTGVRFEKAIAIAANELNIPVVMINDLPVMSANPGFDANICVMNEFAKEYAIKKGVEESKIFVTGQPVMEDNLKLDINKAQKLQERFKSNWSKIILYLGLPETDTIPEGRETIDELEKIAQKHQDWLFILRPHPSNFDNYKVQDTDNLYVTKRGELKYLIELCDVAITHVSTSGIEAALLGKPVITVLNKTESNMRLDELGIAKNVYFVGDLENYIVEVLSNESLMSRELACGRKKFENISDAASNIVEVIMKN